MDPEEERIKYLTRLGKETVIKRGTYDMDKVRTIIQDHPFYQKPEDNGEAYADMAGSGIGEVSEDDAAAMASQIIGNNFKTGLSQDEVDAILNGII